MSKEIAIAIAVPDDFAGTVFCDISELVRLAQKELWPWRIIDSPIAEHDLFSPHNNQLLGFIHDVATNYDCDEDAHRYGTRCRACHAQKLLAVNARQ